MKERSLLLLSLACSFLGLLGLYLISLWIELPQIKVAEVTPELVGQSTRLCGELSWKYVQQRGHVFFRLSDETGSIKVVVFNSSAKQLGAYELKEGQRVCVVGRIDEYKGELEIIPARIDVL